MITMSLSTSCDTKKIDEILSSASTSLEQAAAGVRIVDFDDGHVPETCQEAPTRLVEYFSQYQQPSLVCVHDNAFDSVLVDALFGATIKEDRPWGTYVTKQRIQEYKWSNEKNDTDHDSGCSKERKFKTTEDMTVNAASDDDKERLALLVAAAFFHKALSPIGASEQASNDTCLSQASPKPTIYSSHKSEASPDKERPLHIQQPSLLSQDQFENAVHGIAIWALAADIGSSVPYHLDYAEQVRYATNIIVPPLLAGTLHCTPWRIVGGELRVALDDGIEHYRTHGYKESLSPVAVDGMVCVPYQYNRLAITSGHLPHLSTRVEAIGTVAANCGDGDTCHVNTTDDSDYEQKRKRVIIGFNVFKHDVGPLVEQAPEHSDVFRNWVQHRRLQQQQQRRQQTKGRLTLAMVQANPALAQRLIQAKRAKVRADLIRSQQLLDESILKYLREHASNDIAGVAIADLTTAFETTDGSWPSADDVFAHICRQGKLGKYWKVSATGTEQENESTSARMDLSSRVVLLNKS